MMLSKRFAKRAIADFPSTPRPVPQYLYLSLENMDAPGFEGAKYVFTPPLREKWNQEKLWNWPQARSPAGCFHRPLSVLL